VVQEGAELEWLVWDERWAQGKVYHIGGHEAPWIAEGEIKSCQTHICDLVFIAGENDGLEAVLLYTCSQSC
jgi:hypothetical protein